jgi:oxygen-independent coproporphyrinogen-3 oxidase
LYQLTIEPDTAFERLYKAGKLDMPSPEHARELYEATAQLTAEAGLQAYEISNYAMPSHECQHNLIYWRYQPYIGIGPGAHGRLLKNADPLSRVATSTLKSPEDWLAHVEANGHGWEIFETLGPEEKADEWLLMGLRLQEGIDPEGVRRWRGHAFDPRRVQDLLEHGMIERTAKGWIKATPEGRLVLDAVVADLAA